MRWIAYTATALTVAAWGFVTYFAAIGPAYIALGFYQPCCTVRQPQLLVAALIVAVPIGGFIATVLSALWAVKRGRPGAAIVICTISLALGIAVCGALFLMLPF